MCLSTSGTGKVICKEGTCSITKKKRSIVESRPINKGSLSTAKVVVPKEHEDVIEATL